MKRLAASDGTVFEFGDDFKGLVTIHRDGGALQVPATDLVQLVAEQISAGLVERLKTKGAATDLLWALIEK